MTQCPPPGCACHNHNGHSQWRIQKILVGGGFEAENLKNSDVFTKIESDFSAEIGNSNVFSPKFRWSPKEKKKKKKKRSSPKLRLIFRRISYV